VEDKGFAMAAKQKFKNKANATRERSIVTEPIFSRFSHVDESKVNASLLAWALPDEGK